MIDTVATGLSLRAPRDFIELTVNCVGWQTLETNLLDGGYLFGEKGQCLSDRKWNLPSHFCQRHQQFADICHLEFPAESQDWI
ncbi:hypothetical protein GW643_17230 [Serratia marcescens]|uniref:hypothetical protein n=1 Tax=Serratia marcescens TaxID=615 RepID=UPI0013768104|nr:hypothetical protein [Serratia marcescens]MBH3035812.1 hypothetical protein [Serratia marcescens]MBH3063803.1 hypothetical protein [Serratia marcescens]NCJ12114.1 hypothetical protein [Serratia marcescens]NDJ04670.1 hypothetical protein [Serratia marcescens]